LGIPLKTVAFAYHGIERNAVSHEVL